MNPYPLSVLRGQNEPIGKKHSCQTEALFQLPSVDITACGICPCSGSGRYMPWRCRGYQLSAFLWLLTCWPLRDRYCMPEYRGGCSPCRIVNIGRKTWRGLCGAERPLLFRWVACAGENAHRAVFYDHNRNTAYQKLWISLIIKSITLSKVMI